MIVALSRFGGLRCPSETISLTWQDVDWERGRFLVHSPKTEHHDGKGERWVPIFPELRPYLEAVFDEAEPGTVHVITCKRDTTMNMRTRLAKIIRRAGLTPWPKLFHNLRASRQTELSDMFPAHVVCSWLGNTEAVAMATICKSPPTTGKCAAKSGAVVLQNPVQQPAAQHRTNSQDSTEPDGIAGVCETVRNDASRCGANHYARRDSNPQPMVP